MDLDLIAWMGEGDPVALGELLRRYTGWIRWAVLARLGTASRNELEDVVSDTYQRVVAGYDSFRGGSEAEFRAWLKVIAQRAAGRFTERAARRPDLFDPMDAASTEEPPAMMEMAEVVVDRVRLRSCLDELQIQAPNQHRVIVLQAQSDLPLAATAELLSTEEHTVTVSAIKSWLHRGRMSLMKCLQRGIDDTGDTDGVVANPKTAVNVVPLRRAER